MGERMCTLQQCERKYCITDVFNMLNNLQFVHDKLKIILPQTSGIARVLWAALAKGGKRKLYNSRKNSGCKFHMRFRAIKTEHYRQRVPIVGTVG